MTPASSAAPPLVSVVIPTRLRPELLLQRALPSAMIQSLKNIEIIVVVDGPDPVTEELLGLIEDDRLRVHVLPENCGGSEARRTGIELARAEWIALLDDDDEWLPRKLEQQLHLAHATPGVPVVSCPWITRTPHGDYLNPDRRPDPGEPLSEYMLARRTPLSPTAGLISSVLLAPRSLFLQIPFRKGLPKHQDWDWLLRVAALPEVNFVMTTEVAAVWYYEEARPTVSRQVNWRQSLSWAQGHLAAGTMTRRAYVGFLNSHVLTSAQSSKEQSAILSIALEMLYNRPRPFEVGRFISMCLLSLETRRLIRSRMDKLLERTMNRNQYR